jgi:hypothetical protein
LRTFAFFIPDRVAAAPGSSLEGETKDTVPDLIKAKVGRA